MRVWLLVSLFLMAGCSTTRVVPPPLVLPTAAEVPRVEAMTPPVEPEALILPPLEPSADPHTLTTRANARAVIQPTAEDFVRSTVVFRYRPGAIYRAILGEKEPMVIALQPGERLLIFANGEERFQAEKTEDHDPVHIVVRPTRDRLKGRMTLVTTLGAYYLDLRSRASNGLTSVMWRHPTKAAPTDGTGVYGVGYGIPPKEGVNQAYRPLYAWDNGKQTFLLFPETMPRTKAPIVSVGQVEGEPLVVNYVARHRTFRIDRLLDAGEHFELRVNALEEAVVTVQKTADYRLIRCPGSEECGVIARWTRRGHGR